MYSLVRTDYTAFCVRHEYNQKQALIESHTDNSTVNKSWLVFGRLPECLSSVRSFAIQVEFRRTIGQELASRRGEGTTQMLVVVVWPLKPR